MLRVWFGYKEGSVYDTSTYFDNRFQERWMKEQFSIDLIRAVYKDNICPAPEDLSCGVKTVILMKHFPGIYFNGSTCGNNCAPWILRLGRQQNCRMVLYHTMDFGDGPFDIRIMNRRGMIAHDMLDVLDASVEFLHRSAN